ncbi:MAG: L-seryl-tRNA(Sec) selenium transferase, partial [Planctomycetota bacterium]
MLRKLPSVDVLLKDPDLESCVANTPRKVVVNSIREAVSEVRELLIAQKMSGMDEYMVHQRIVADAKRRIQTILAPYYRRVVNATGIILHTGLGRAVLASQALQQIQEQFQGYSLL